jgi:predicted nucleic acid-binding protein
MPRYVLDANVILGWLLARPDAVSFMGSLTSADELYSPQVQFPECTSVLRTEVFDGRIAEPEASILLDRALDLPSQAVESDRQFVRSLDLAQRFQRRKAYDMQYLAVAEMTGSEIVTRDRGLRHAAEAIGVPVRLLE